jgi:hypothetical protein
MVRAPEELYVEMKSKTKSAEGKTLLIYVLFFYFLLHLTFCSFAVCAFYILLFYLL